MSLQAVGLAADTEAADRVALTRLQDAMPPGTRLISDTIRFSPGQVLLEDPKTLALSLTGEGTLLREIDADAVRSAVLGLPPEEARRVLAERFALARPRRSALGRTGCRMSSRSSCRCCPGASVSRWIGMRRRSWR